MPVVRLADRGVRAGLLAPAEHRQRQAQDLGQPRRRRALGAARPGDDVPHWARLYDEAQLADEFGHCHRDLQQYRASAQHAERSLQLRAPGFARSRLFCRVVLATARLGLGELDQACALGAEAAQQAMEMRSVRAVEYVRDFERRLEPYRVVNAGRRWYLVAFDLGPREWRTHFHVPVFLNDLGAFGTTRFALEQALAFHKKTPLSAHLEIETYTWDVLPDHLKTGDIVDYVCRELDWVKGELV